MSSFYYGLGYRLQCNVFSYDYSGLFCHIKQLCWISMMRLGYGCSTGKPSEKNLYADIAAALQALKSRYQISEEEVILYGQSIGTVPSVDVATHNPNIAGLILHSPLMSGVYISSYFCFIYSYNYRYASSLSGHHPYLLLGRVSFHR